ncbi:hypothetical protein [Paenarthrobacter sp. YJN-D]|uniref:hypothetical protein n=1 Tax=Paenarthrobacter sp. YJN-D TaxID=2735317 RepID=UPI001878699C|nr:hypothetical protein [Paenarthrobacter sp. YJN-D]QOT21653.1 hypothetical protein HMI60_08990 [Paenarthrobacter sp. YJN-D]
MGEIHVDARLNIVELSGIAWAETVRRAAEATGSEADAAAYPEYFPHPDAHHQDAGDELRRAGILDAQGTLSPQWILAVTLAVSAPLTATTVVQFQDQSIHSRAGLAGGRGVAVSYRRRISHQPNGVVVTEVRNAVEVSFFQEENAWAALSRHFPRFHQLEPLPEATPQAVAANTSCTIHLEVSGHLDVPGTPAPGFRPYTSRRVWAVADQLYSVDQLNSVETGPGQNPSPTLTAVPSTDPGLEFAWSLLGAKEYLGSAAGRSVRS